MAKEIGALRVFLGADTAAFETGLKNASKGLDKFAANAVRHGRNVATALVAAAAAFGYAVKKTLDDADKMGEIAQKIGIPVDALSRLRHAAQLSGATFEQLETAMGRFSRNMMQAASDSQSSAARAFSSIGVSATTATGQIRPTTEVMADIAGRFSGMQDGAGKTALAMELFGRSGAALIPMLNAGRDGLNAMMREADALGIVIDNRTAQAAGRFNDNLDRLQKAGSGLAVKLSSELLPALEMLTGRFLEFVRNGESVKAVADGMNAVFGFVAKNVSSLAVFFSRLGSEISDLGRAFQAGMPWTQAYRDVIAQSTRDTQTAVAALRQFHQEIDNSTSAWRAYVEFAPTVAMAQAPIIASARSVADAAKKMDDTIRAAMDAVINAPTETFAAKMNAVEAALESGSIKFREFGQLTRRINDDNVSNMHDLASATSSALTTIWSKSKVAAIASAVINTAQGITRNLAQYPQPLAGIMAAITAASGAAQIAAIKSSNMGGGGSAPSASAASGGAAEAAAGPMQTLMVQGIDPNSIMGGASVRMLAEKLLAYQRDGGQVVIA